MYLDVEPLKMSYFFKSNFHILYIYIVINFLNCKEEELEFCQGEMVRIPGNLWSLKAAHVPGDLPELRGDQKIWSTMFMVQASFYSCPGEPCLKAAGNIFPAVLL